MAEPPAAPPVCANCRWRVIRGVPCPLREHVPLGNRCPNWEAEPPAAPAPRDIAKEIAVIDGSYRPDPAPAPPREPRLCGQEFLWDHIDSLELRVAMLEMGFCGVVEKVADLEAEVAGMADSLADLMADAKADREMAADRQADRAGDRT